MKSFKQVILCAAMLAMLSSQTHSVALNPCPKPCKAACMVDRPRPEIDQEYRTDLGGYGYERLRRVPSLAPAIALGTVLLSAIVAMGLQNTSHDSHSHSHSHFHGDCASSCF